MRDGHLVLFSCCIPVKGARRSIICDLQRESYELIPNLMFDILQNFHGRPIREIYEFAGKANEDNVREYLDYLLKKNFCFITNEPENFPRLSLDWQSPHYITNAIIDFEIGTKHNLGLLKKEIQSVGCAAVQLRFYFPVTPNNLLQILSEFEFSRLRSIEVVLQYSKKAKEIQFQRLFEKNPRLSSLFAFNSPFDKVVPVRGTSSEIIFSRNVFDSPVCCGAIGPSKFRVNTPMFTESIKFNSCLNRKISVDSKGNVKNCPTSEKSFGKLGDRPFKEIISMSEFTRLWKINKNEVAVCKDCEFRLICTDCRILLSNPEDIYSKPKKCTYDPYEAVWAQRQ